ncbi:hypothetical protein J6590_009187 [Homalodisca vitripennis]|nr:hypothetical protein J6590_009187 [Homalodisca vitripennis]
MFTISLVAEGVRDSPCPQQHSTGHGVHPHPPPPTGRPTTSDVIQDQWCAEQRITRSSLRRNLNDEMETEQQIMLVRGNGDIFNAEITPDRAIKEHPLTISSGTTAFISENWSIMVMPCYPPIVVIVSDDFIYHFVLFESGNMKAYITEDDHHI